MQPAAMATVDQLMRNAVEDHVFPGAVLLVARNDRIVFFDAYGTANLETLTPVDTATIFDLASLTKPLATTVAVMQLVREQELDLEAQLGSILPDFADTDKAQIRIKHLLRHTSGLPDYFPFFDALQSGSFQQRLALLRQRLVQLPLRQRIGATALYSDLGFMILGWVVQTLTRRRLDEYVRDAFYTPLGLDGENGDRLCFVDLDAPIKFEKVAATERCPWRKTVLEGVVHDDNAFVMGGIAGHAGLFGNAGGVYRVIRSLLKAYQGDDRRGLFEPILVRRFFERDSINRRPLGFDAPAATDASCGKFFSERSVGHLGFTGTSFWIDLDKSVTVILLANRVHPSRTNEKIREFRPLIHDAVMEEFA
jgi:CubicO group peptidase (beta-lactamase class C family)